MSSTYGHILRLSIFGQSHANAIGMTLDGLPAGRPIDEAQLARFLARRAPGQNEFSTTRKEPDAPEFLCGLVNGRTCGAPLTAIIRNTNTRPGDYASLRTLPRPGHADYTAECKYHGFQDPTGGGHFSGRLTAPLCIAGGVCLQVLQQRGVRVFARIASIADVADTSPFTEPVSDKPFPVTDDAAGEQMQAAIRAAKADGDSVGGTVECVADGLPTGLGDGMFDGMESRLAQILFGIPAVKGLEFGAGFEAARLRGSEDNDAFCVQNGRVATETNHSGGTLGGITNGMPLRLRAAFKPTPSIAKTQQSVNLNTLREEPLNIHGRHDPCIVPRTVPCVEAAVAIALLDSMLEFYGTEYFYGTE